MGGSQTETAIQKYQQGCESMTIGEYIQEKDKEIYKKLTKLTKPKIPLGDKIENLMYHDSYKRVNRRIRQR